MTDLHLPCGDYDRESKSLLEACEDAGVRGVSFGDGMVDVLFS